MRGRSALRIPDSNACAQRQFEERRAPPLYRSYRPCALDDARAPGGSILVSGVRPAHFARGPDLAPLVHRPVSGGIFCRRSRRVIDRPLPDGSHDRRLHIERLSRTPRIAGEHLLIAGSDKHNYGHYLQDIVPLIDLGAKMGVPMLTWSLKPWQRALIARLDVPHGLIREIRPRPVFLEHAISSNRFIGPEQPERTSAKSRSVWTNPRQRAKAYAGDKYAPARAYLPKPVKQPKRHQSRGDDRGAQSPRLCRDPAGQA